MKGVCHFGIKGKLAPCYIGLYPIREKYEPLAHRVELPVGVFCTGNMLGGQDHAFQFHGGLANNEAHSDLSWFRSLLGGNSPTCSGLI
jgi:hypothetical protein